MILSKIILKDIMERYDLNDSILNRCTGKSTGEALITLGQAIRYPNTRFKFIDHFGTFDSNRVQMKMAQNMAQTLNLKYLEFNKIDNSVICNSILEDSNERN